MTRPALRLLAALALLAAPVTSPGVAAAQVTEADIYVAEGILAVEDRKYEEALAHFQRALAEERDHVEALYYSGVAHMGRGDPAAALPFLERARQKSPAEPSIAFQLGLAHFALKQHDRAQPLLEEVFAAEPELDSLGYYVGFLRHQRGDFQGALRAFRAGRTTDPNVVQLTRFYTGLALAELGLTAQATSEVEQALRARPASPLTGPAERLRDSLRASAERQRRFRADASLGVFYDDNATARPNRRPEDPTVHDLRRPRHETVGENFSLRLEYDWFRSGPWESTGGYTFFTTYNNDIPGLNLIDHLGTLGITRRQALGDMPLHVGGQYSYEFLVLDDDEFLQRHAVSLFGMLVESARHLTNLQVRVESKEYSELRPIASQEFQDAENVLVGLLHVLRFDADRHFVKMGYQVDRDNTRGANFDYWGHRFLGGFQYTLPWWDVKLSYDYSLHYRDYLFRHSRFPESQPGTRERSDHEQSHAARIELPLPNNFRLAGDYLATISRSNLAPFSYEREVFTLSVLWQY